MLLYIIHLYILYPHTQLDVQDFDDIKSGYKIVFRFAENPFFSDAVLEKTFSFDEEGALSVRSTMPSWKPGKVGVLMSLRC